ncbi:hypothetical protein B0J12DRAFT_41899 [Macrophomina phaseolina]|uniref:Uncharacterized protein n=1 Tax=Macrophomina phaseolina TaxID=35725 RepID=A0ABQ8GWG6_9PEZI|nr:hypothetical protein B0J12DRAFT_41899 [Macrophomina phaseolina]
MKHTVPSQRVVHVRPLSPRTLQFPGESEVSAEKKRTIHVNASTRSRRRRAEEGGKKEGEERKRHVPRPPLPLLMPLSGIAKLSLAHERTHSHSCDHTNPPPPPQKMITRAKSDGMTGGSPCVFFFVPCESCCSLTIPGFWRIFHAIHARLSLSCGRDIRSGTIGKSGGGRGVCIFIAWEVLRVRRRPFLTSTSLHSQNWSSGAIF